MAVTWIITSKARQALQRETLQAEVPALSRRVRWLQSLPEAAPVLLTTADHALLHSEVVDHFCAAARRTGVDQLRAA